MGMFNTRCHGQYGNIEVAATIRAMSDANIDLKRKLDTVYAATEDIKKLYAATKKWEETNSQINQSTTVTTAIMLSIHSCRTRQFATC